MAKYLMSRKSRNENLCCVAAICRRAKKRRSEGGMNKPDSKNCNSNLDLRLEAVANEHAVETVPLDIQQPRGVGLVAIACVKGSDQ